METDLSAPSSMSHTWATQWVTTVRAQTRWKAFIAWVIVWLITWSPYHEHQSRRKRHLVRGLLYDWSRGPHTTRIYWYFLFFWLKHYYCFGISMYLFRCLNIQRVYTVVYFYCHSFVLSSFVDTVIRSCGRHLFILLYRYRGKGKQNVRKKCIFRIVKTSHVHERKVIAKAGNRKGRQSQRQVIAKAGYRKGR